MVMCNEVGSNTVPFEELFYVNDEGAGQLAHSCSLISTFVIR